LENENQRRNLEMKEFKYVITDPEGIHARPAGILVKQAAGYQSSVKIAKGEKSADAKRIFGVMGLGVKTGEEVTITVEGADEDTAAAELETFFKENL
jgi:phosphocarrier protein